MSFASSFPVSGVFGVVGCVLILWFADVENLTVNDGFQIASDVSIANLGRRLDWVFAGVYPTAYMFSEQCG